MPLTILIVAGVIYLAGYVITAAVFLSWVGSLEPVGVLAALCESLAWPILWFERLTNTDRPPLK